MGRNLLLYCGGWCARPGDNIERNSFGDANAIDVGRKDGARIAGSLTGRIEPVRVEAHFT